MPQDPLQSVLLQQADPDNQRGQAEAVEISLPMGQSLIEKRLIPGPDDSLIVTTQDSSLSGPHS